MDSKVTLVTSVVLGICATGALPTIAAAEQQRLDAAEAVDDSNFGESIDIDGKTAIVGAPGSGPDGFRTGNAHIYTKADGSWARQQKLTFPDASTEQGLGEGVAIEGDTAIVGGSGEFFDGAVYVFNREGESWKGPNKLESPGSSGYGADVALEGDVALIGAPHADDGDVQQAGAVHVLKRSGGAWNRQQKLVASDPENLSLFGWRLAFDGETIVVGAPDASGGAAYLFTRNGDAWNQQQKVTAPDSEAPTKFGNSVAIDGETLIVGAHSRRTTETGPGAAYVYTRSGGEWSHQQTLTACDAANNDQFGSSVALQETTALVGAIFNSHDGMGERQGAAYVFTKSGGSWTGGRKLAESGTDLFGHSAAIDGDVMMVGAMNERDGASYAGAVHVYARSAESDGNTSCPTSGGGGSGSTDDASGGCSHPASEPPPAGRLLFGAFLCLGLAVRRRWRRHR